MVVVFICVANSARSQMAEGIARHTAPAGVTVFSAGSKPGTLSPYAVTALAEMGIDISTHRSKGFDAVPIDTADYVITLCGEEECPYIVSPARRLSWAMPDPAAANGRDARVAAFREARDDIAQRLQGFWETELASRDRQ